MKTIRFNGDGTPAYTCDTPGDQSGEYVRAEVAKELLKALEAMIEVHVEGHLLRSESGLGEDEMIRAAAHAEKAARAAIAAARE